MHSFDIQISAQNEHDERMRSISGERQGQNEERSKVGPLKRCRPHFVEPQKMGRTTQKLFTFSVRLSFGVSERVFLSFFHHFNFKLVHAEIANK